MPAVRSLVWNYFNKSEENSLATCLFCKTSVNISNGNTSSMRKYLSKHPTKYNKLLKLEQERTKAKVKSKRRPRTNLCPTDSNQTTVKDLFTKKEKVSLYSKEQKRFDEAMVDQLCCTATPYNWCEHPKVKKLFDIINPTLTVKSGITYSRQISQAVADS